MSDVTFGTWTAAASPLTIEYSLVVIEEIRHHVAEGFQKLSRGGIEVGGLLYGVHEGQTVRIMAIRPAACEHAGGPAFRLSERDRAALHEQIRQDRSDPRLDDLVCVGWYVSHTRTDIALTESDQEIFSSFFAEPKQVTLVVRPVRGGNMRAGFFVREPDGTVNASQSYLEFSFPDRLAAAFDQNRTAWAERQPSGRGMLRVPTQPVVPQPAVARPVMPTSAVPAPDATARPMPATHTPVVQNPARPQPHNAAPPLPPASQQKNAVPTVSHTASNLTSLFGEATPANTPVRERANYVLPDSFDDSAKSSTSKKWLILSAALIVVAGGTVAGARFLTSGAPNETLALSVLERDGQLDIQWNRQAAPVTHAILGSLEIADGPQNRTIPLKPEDLALGKFSYKRDSGDIQVRMIVQEADGEKVQEASRFLGPPPVPANTDELKALQQRRDELEAEVTRLKQSNDDQAQRIQQLERTLKILQTRQGN